MEVLMKNAGKFMQGISLHYYTLPTGNWNGSKGSATEFDEARVSFDAGQCTENGNHHHQTFGHHG